MWRSWGTPCHSHAAGASSARPPSPPHQRPDPRAQRGPQGSDLRRRCPRAGTAIWIPPGSKFGPRRPLGSGSLSSSAPGRAGPRGVGDKKPARPSSTTGRGGAEWGGIEAGPWGLAEVLGGDRGSQGERPLARGTQVEGKRGPGQGPASAAKREGEEGKSASTGLLRLGVGGRRTVEGNGEALPKSSPHPWLWALRPRSEDLARRPSKAPILRPSSRPCQPPPGGSSP